MAVIEDCSHATDLTFVRHLRNGLHECLDCGHTGYLKDRPYYCYHCPGVHSLTWAEMQKHRTEFHPTVKHDDT